MKRDLDKLVASMSIGLTSITMTDAPHGMRKQSEKADMVGVDDSIPATCFPSGAALAARRSGTRSRLRASSSAIVSEEEAR
jgi:beta-glucosidase